MAASINGTQIQSTAQSLAAYLQALQAKNDGTNTTLAGQNSGGDIGTASTVVNGTGQATKSATTAKDQAEQVSNQPLDVVNLSAEAQRLLANAQTSGNASGGLAALLNTDNNTGAASADPFGAGYVGAIARFRQWLAQPLGQPIPTPIGQVNTDNISKSTNSGDQTTGNGTPAVSSTST
jgi:hypothetical protein